MSFIERFYSFVIDLTSVERNIYQKLRLKIPLFPAEEPSDLLYRIFAYLHSYSAELQFSANPLDNGQPTLSARDHQGGIAQWVSVGLPDLKELRLASKRYQQATFSIYFVNDHQIERFCHSLRGTKENWIAHMRFFIIKSEQLDKLTSSISSSSRWQVNHVEETIYLDFDSGAAEINFQPIEIWQQYQQTLRD